MQAGLQGKKVALVATDDASQVSAWRRALEQAGAVVEVLGRNGTMISPALDYEALVAIGASGEGPADRARAQFPREIVQLVKEMAVSEKPVVALGSAVTLLAGAHASGDPLTNDVRLWTGTGSNADATRVVTALGGAVSQAAVDQMSDQSFPASDPPSTSPASVGRPATRLESDARG